MTTTPATDAMEAVVQADRDAAAELIVANEQFFNRESWIENVRAGRCDNEAFVQAFAAHRLAHTPASIPREPSGAMVEAALHARVPGGAEVWCFLPQKDSWTPSQTARDVIRCALRDALALTAPADGSGADARPIHTDPAYRKACAAVGRRAIEALPLAERAKVECWANAEFWAGTLARQPAERPGQVAEIVEALTRLDEAKQGWEAGERIDGDEAVCVLRLGTVRPIEQAARSYVALATGGTHG